MRIYSYFIVFAAEKYNCWGYNSFIFVRIHLQKTQWDNPLGFFFVKEVYTERTGPQSNTTPVCKVQKYEKNNNKKTPGQPHVFYHINVQNIDFGATTNLYVNACASMLDWYSPKVVLMDEPMMKKIYLHNWFQLYNQSQPIRSAMTCWQKVVTITNNIHHQLETVQSQDTKPTSFTVLKSQKEIQPKMEFRMTD